jgi:SNF2 family DNA or RNA helicase
LELIESSIESGHRLLLFSQFTSMLDILQTELSKRDIEYFRLDGSTPTSHRLGLVDRFNAGTVPVFLISLKAGGTGLNLTGADVVIHYDPWWNLSVQRQATDRAHRIGQEKRVQEFKLIVKGSIEERILEMQQRKAELANSVIQEGGSAFDKLTSEELMSLFNER